jgi:3D (Asp-Asp-Asp) domain-containing protein
MVLTSVISRRTFQSVVIPAALLFHSSLIEAGQTPNGVYRATAYAQSGTTASGEITHRHVVAADPDILPLGSRIKIRRAGKYSGEYVVADTGAKIQGRRLDIYMPNEKACIKFGTKLVRVRVVQLGDGTRAATKQADRVVKEEVTREVQKQAVGGAATEEDWARAKAQGKAGTPPSANPKPPDR